MTKTDLKNISHIDVSSHALKSNNLASLKAEVDKLDIDKLTSVSVDLATLSNVVKNDVVKKTEYDELVNKANNNILQIAKLNNIIKNDTTNLEDKIDKVEKKIPDITNLATKSSVTSLLPASTFNSKTTEIENKITSVDKQAHANGLLIKIFATKGELALVENKIPDTNGFV